MGSTQRGEHTDGGLNNVVQSHHLTRLTDAGLEESHLRILIEQPYRQGHANLRVIALGRARHLPRWQQQLVEPLLDHRLAVGARDAHDRDGELVAMALSQPLQGSQRRSDTQEIGIRKEHIQIIPGETGNAITFYRRKRIDHKRAHPATVEFGDVLMAIVAMGAECEKQGLLGETK